MVTSINRYVPVLSITLLGFAVLLSPAMPASAASRGLTASGANLTLDARACGGDDQLGVHFQREVPATK